MNYLTARICELATVVGGGTPNTSIGEYWDGDIPWISPADLSGYNNVYISRGAKNITGIGLEKSSAQILPEGAVLLSSRAPIGYIAIAKNPLSTNQGFKSLVCNEKYLHNRYLYYYLKQNMSYIQSFASGSTFPELSGNRLKQIKITISADINKQRCIADVLSSYDDLIENNNKRISLLEKAAQEVYKEWFVRFRFPGYGTAKFENGLPKGWKREKFSSVVEIGRGASPRPIADSRYFVEGNIPWIKIADATSSTMFIFNTKEYVNEFGASFSRILHEGDLILAASGTLGFPMFLATTGCIHDGWLYFRSFQRVSAQYVYYALLDLRNQFNNFSYGAAIQNINTDIVRKSIIVIPPESLLSVFQSKIVLYHDMIKLLLKKNQNLAKQRDLLLPRLMSGKLEM